MELTKQEKDIVCRKFCSYCIKVLYGEAMEYLEELEKLHQKEVSFSELFWEDWNKLYTYDELEPQKCFRVMDMDILVRDEDISNAIAKLPEKKRLIILMAYFLDMTEKEIAEYMNLVQSTVHYHKADSLKILKKLME